MPRISTKLDMCSSLTMQASSISDGGVAAGIETKVAPLTESQQKPRTSKAKRKDEGQF